MTAKVHFSLAVPPPKTSSETAPNRTGASACGADGLGDDDLDDVVRRCGLALVAAG